MTLMPVHLNSGHVIDNDVVGHILSFLPSDSLAAFGITSSAHYRFTIDKVNENQKKFFDAVRELGISWNITEDLPIFSCLKVHILGTKNLIIDEFLLKLDEMALQTLKIVRLPEFLKNTLKVAENARRIPFAESLKDSLELEEIALNLCNLGEHERAYEAAKKIPDENLQSRTIETIAISQKEIALGLVESGRTVRALRVALDIADREVQWEAFVEVLESLVEPDPLDELRHVVSNINKNMHRHRIALGTLVGTLLSAGRMEEARAIANSLPNKYGQAVWLNKIVEFLISADRMKEARNVANDMRLESMQSETLQKIVEILIQAGRLEEAGDVAKDISGMLGRRISARIFRLCCAQSIRVVQKPQNQS